MQKLNDNPEKKEIKAEKKKPIRGLYLNHVDEVADIM